jgi:hypothetical protein
MLWKNVFLILIVRFYTSAAARDYSRMITVHGEEADQSHPQTTTQQKRMLQEIPTQSPTKASKKDSKKKSWSKGKG